MTLIRTMKLTPHQAKDLKHMGFILLLVKLFCGEVDEYQVFVK